MNRTSLHFAASMIAPFSATPCSTQASRWNALTMLILVSGHEPDVHLIEHQGWRKAKLALVGEFQIPREVRSLSSPGLRQEIFPYFILPVRREFHTWLDRYVSRVERQFLRNSS